MKSVGGVAEAPIQLSVCARSTAGIATRPAPAAKPPITARRLTLRLSKLMHVLQRAFPSGARCPGLLGLAVSRRVAGANQHSRPAETRALCRRAYMRSAASAEGKALELFQNNILYRACPGPFEGRVRSVAHAGRERWLRREGERPRPARQAQAWRTTSGSLPESRQSPLGGPAREGILASRVCQEQAFKHRAREVRQVRPLRPFSGPPLRSVRPYVAKVPTE